MTATSLFVYGVLENVRLSQAELGKLQERFTPDGAQEWIDLFSEQKAAHGYKYKSDYAAILAWARRQNGKNMKQQSGTDVAKAYIQRRLKKE